MVIVLCLCLFIISFLFFISMFTPSIFIVYCYLFVPKMLIPVYIYITLSNYVTNARKIFVASAPSSGSFHIACAKVIKY